ncbi:hypothetical protein PSECIP111951_00983 [Pseudoalteromonas holothuriae]|uniref:Type II toxin-antitoxin system MqsR family toxin n=1 Tax=Pseudoalteromonas holothuriae TaxID=2963714 RepID=A0ABM9GFD6_9GAMM|nr:type II toxin-antitoxin system MqsR family toxin [Pseudoalteromonas sp. CIP111951]CAH9054197.1 hypothetical protein PSECIP111951_00983 [Pseudoalteromonas sp. CIP111951]
MAEYDLEQVKAAAQNLDIEYRGRKVSRDIANLGYDLNDVSACLCQLSESDFRKTHNYDKQPPDDEYICRYRKDSREDEFDELYVKFCLIDDCLVVDLASFHLPQY